MSTTTLIFFGVLPTLILVWCFPPPGLFEDRDVTPRSIDRFAPIRTYVTDPITGCQYFVNWRSRIVAPRFEADGKTVRCEPL